MALIGSPTAETSQRHLKSQRWRHFHRALRFYRRAQPGLKTCRIRNRWGLSQSSHTETAVPHKSHSVLSGRRRTRNLLMWQVRSLLCGWRCRSLFTKIQILWINKYCWQKGLASVSKKSPSLCLDVDTGHRGWAKQLDRTWLGTRR